MKEDELRRQINNPFEHKIKQQESQDSIIKMTQSNNASERYNR